MTSHSVSQGQLFKLFALHLFTTMIAFMLGIMIQQSGYNGPIGILAGAFLGLGIAFFAYRLGIRRSDRFFIDYGKDIVGRWLHYPLVLFIAISNLLIAIINFWELQDFLTQFYLVDTPSWAIVGLCALCVAYTVRFGITSVFRTAEGIFILSLISFLVIPLLVSEHFQWFMGRGIVSYFSIREAWPAVYYTASVYGEMSFVLFIFPYLTAPKRTMRSLTWSTFVSAFLIFIHVVPLLLIFGEELTSILNYPEMELLRFMRNGSFLETLDPALIALWVISLFVKLSFIIFIVCLILAQLTGLKNPRPIVLPVTVFIAVCSLAIVKSNIQFHSMMSGGILTLFFISELIPILYYVTDSVRSSLAVRFKRGGSG